MEICAEDHITIESNTYLSKYYNIIYTNNIIIRIFHENAQQLPS